jgi:hypothetical protein
MLKNKAFKNETTNRINNPDGTPKINEATKIGASAISNFKKGIIGKASERQTIDNTNEIAAKSEFMAICLVCVLTSTWYLFSPVNFQFFDYCGHAV